MSKPTRKEILALIIAYFLLSQDEQDLLIAAIYTALRAAMIASYRWNAHRLGIPSEWLPNKDEEDALQALAKLRGEQITATYEDNVIRATTTFLDAYEKANGSLEAVLPDLRDTLKQYTDARTEQKAEEISKYETGEGANKGINVVIGDITNADEGDNVYVSDEDMARIFVGVMPETSRGEDECEEWAGEMVELLEADIIPDFPIHQNCPHYRVLIDMRDEVA